MKTDAQFWDGAASKYAKAKIGDEAGYKRTLERTKEFLTPQSRVMELGCGTGTTAFRLAPHTGSYLATDISPGMIAIANEKLAKTSIPNLSFETGTAETIPLDADGFDVVLGFNYLHLVADPEATLRSVQALLKPGGLVITKTVSLKEMNRLIPVAISVLRLIGKAPANIARMNEADVKRAHEQAGFEILHKERHGTKGKDVRPYIVARRN